MKRTIGIIGKIFLISCISIFCMFPAAVKAAGTAHFYVQTADVQDDGTLEVTVYLTDAKNMGGVEAELIYDSSKVSYVDARLGTSLETTLADVYHNEEKSLIKYVALYQEAQEPHGALMKVTFQLKEGESYQPQLHVIGLVDDSDEVADIPFDVSYQQADGSWSEEQDTSGVKAEGSVIREALTDYGSPEDQQEAGMQVNREDGAGENASGDADADNARASDAENAAGAESQQDAADQEPGAQKDGSSTVLIVMIAVFVVLAAAGCGVIIWRKRKK